MGITERLEATATAWENNSAVRGELLPSPAMLREAAAEIERLRGLVGGSDDLSQSLIDEIESLRLDADRYRWLVAQAMDGGLEAFVAMAQLDHYHDAEKIHAAIDATMG